ncbi:MAG: aminopeptidase P family protein [Spirochaetales bacterium]|nr:aminopeptidase P family protein [Spirochaetales bacterium]
MKALGTIDKVRRELERTSMDALLVFGTDNIRYLTGAVLPFLHSWPADSLAVMCFRHGNPVCIAPEQLKDTVKYGGNISNVQGYDDIFGLPGKVKECLEKYTGTEASVGITLRRISSETYGRLCETENPGCFIPADDWFARLRMVKTPAERALLEKVAFKTDHGLAGAAHHVMVYAPRVEKGLSEIIRVHCVERGLDMTGYEALAVGASGSHAALHWPDVPYYGVGRGKMLKEGEFVRMEIRTNLNGYWSDAARMLIMGLPDRRQAEAYGQVREMNRESLRILRPGVKCSEAAEEALEYARRQGIDLDWEHGLGHGVGVSPVEPPYLDPSDSTELEEGMVLVLTAGVKGSESELIRSYDTVVLEPGGARLTGWYKKWDEPYKAARSYQHGGG